MPSECLFISSGSTVFQQSTLPFYPQPTRFTPVDPSVLMIWITCSEIVNHETETSNFWKQYGYRRVWPTYVYLKTWIWFRILLWVFFHGFKIYGGNSIWLPFSSHYSNFATALLVLEGWFLEVEGTQNRRWSGLPVRPVDISAQSVGLPYPHPLSFAILGFVWKLVDSFCILSIFATIIVWTTSYTVWAATFLLCHIHLTVDEIAIFEDRLGGCLHESHHDHEYDVTNLKKRAKEFAVSSPNTHTFEPL